MKFLAFSAMAWVCLIQISAKHISIIPNMNVTGADGRRVVLVQISTENFTLPLNVNETAKAGTDGRGVIKDAMALAAIPIEIIGAIAEIVLRGGQKALEIALADLNGPTIAQNPVAKAPPPKKGK